MSPYERHPHRDDRRSVFDPAASVPPGTVAAWRTGPSGFGLLFAAYLVTFGLAVAVSICRPLETAPRGLLAALGLVAFLLAVTFLMYLLAVPLGRIVSEVSASLRARASAPRPEPELWDPWIDENGWAGGQPHER